MANLAMVLGFLLAPLMWLPYLPVRQQLRFAMNLFFLTGAISHLALALDFAQQNWMVVIHSLQALSLLSLVIGLWNMLRSSYVVARPGSTWPAPPPPHRDPSELDEDPGLPPRQ